MTPGMNDDAVTSELSFDELDAVAGGFSWGGLLKAVLGGAASGAAGGAGAGCVGAGPGAIGGGILGGLGYLLHEIF